MQPPRHGEPVESLLEGPVRSLHEVGGGEGNLQIRLIWVGSQFNSWSLAPSAGKTFYYSFVEVNLHNNEVIHFKRSVR